ncbi:hypothetical protein ACFQ05_03370 [Amycolatopsis umgeniensis]|uniref:REase associating with pPIWI RE domain-containing protein n=1 Tax=Amycolatopsis umgeniensis TaxID=336628 RepID=A0A841B097_9PSEU|nr:hypothetical protein [Amycolatopsis umgeniensis]
MTTLGKEEQLLGTVASALVTLDELRDLTAFRMPYPAKVQSALDRLALHCLRRGARPPSSAPGLVRWGYQRPLGSWPLVLPTDVYPDDGFLVDKLSGAPTALCHEIALCAEAANPFLEVSRQVAEMAAFAAERGRTSAYGATRNVLAAHPVLTEERLSSMVFKPGVRVLDEYLGKFYVKIGPGFAIDGRIHACDGCGGLLLPAGEEGWWCEREECAAEGLVTPGEYWDYEVRIRVQGDRRHRQFVSDPGKAVLRLGDKIARAGVRVEYWPLTGTGDLRVTVPGGEARTVRIVDWHSPALLGRAIAASVAGTGADIAYWVVAQYRIDADPGYQRIATEHAKSSRIFSEDQFADMLRQEASSHA